MYLQMLYNRSGMWCLRKKKETWNVTDVTDDSAGKANYVTNTSKCEIQHFSFGRWPQIAWSLFESHVLATRLLRCERASIVGGVVSPVQLARVIVSLTTTDVRVATLSSRDVWCANVAVAVGSWCSIRISAHRVPQQAVGSGKLKTSVWQGLISGHSNLMVLASASHTVDRSCTSWSFFFSLHFF